MTVVDCESEPGRLPAPPIGSRSQVAGPSLILERDAVSNTLTRRRRVLTRGRGTALAATLLAAALAPGLILPSLASAATGSSTGTAGSTTSATSATSAAATTRAQAAKYGAGWLARQITANGGDVSSSGVDVSDTAYAVLALHAAGVGKAASDQAVAWLETQLGTGLEAGDGSDDPGKLGYDIMAAVSAGVNPRQFGGTGAANDLVTRLLATIRTTGPDTGLFGSADPSFDGAFRQGTALAALKAAGVSKATVAPALAWLQGQQCANGLWESYRSDTTAACDPADPNTFSGPDTNSTSMAVQGLAAWHEKPGKASILTAFRQIQSADGGFADIAAKGQSSDPDSTALVIQAILAEGANPASAGFTKAGATPYDALTSYQLGCSARKAYRGSFYYPFGTPAPSLLATVQAVPAEAATTFPLAASTPSTAVPQPACTTPSPSSSATSSATSNAVKQAGTAGACAAGTGVTVAVDFQAFGGGTVVRCDPGKPKTGVAAMQDAGFTVAGTSQYGLAFVCRIDNDPTPAQQPCITTPPATAYWAMYTAGKSAKKWTYSATGASTYKPAQGSIEAWAFGNSATPAKTPAQVRATTS